MATTPGVVEASPGKIDDHKVTGTPDVHNVSHQIQKAKEAYKEFARFEDPPGRGEMIVWYIYGLCSHFIETVLIPIVFPLIVSQMEPRLPEPPQGWGRSRRGLPCTEAEMRLYKTLTQPSISFQNMNFSPLHWVSISWAAGVVLSAPLLAGLAFHLDHGRNQQIISGAAVAIGAIFCLPAGFFRTHWPFLPYTAAIIVAATVATAGHTRHMGLMVRGFTGPTVPRSQFGNRGSVASWLSLYGTAAGSLGAAVISAFTYHMLRRSDKLTSLWVVSIFSGLKWLVGVSHAFLVYRPGPEPGSDGANNLPTWTHGLVIFKYPHAAGSIAGIFFSSFATSCLVTGGLLYVVGELCLKPWFILCLWLTYFIVPMFSLPLLHPLQILIRADALRMQLFGFLLSAVVSGVGFFFRNKDWAQGHVLLAAVCLSTSAGVLHAFGRVLLLDCSPPGKEGAFSVWFAWVRAIGTCGGFALATAFPSSINISFGVSFWAALAGSLVLIFGNVSHFGGAVAAGHVKETESEKGSPAHGLDSTEFRRGSVHTEM